MTLPPDNVFLLRPHLGYPQQSESHPHHEMIVVVRGTYRATCEAGPIVLGVGEAVCYPSGFEHFARYDVDAPTFFCIQWPVGDDNLGERPLVGADPSLRLCVAARWLHDQFLRTERDPSAEVGLLTALVAEVRRLAVGADAEAGGIDGVETVRRVLKANIHANHAMADLAAMAGLGPRQLGRRFRARYGCLPMDYLRQVRVETATSMLANRQGTVSEIAHTCGFASASYLSRVIRAHTGLAPRQIRAGGTKVGSEQNVRVPHRAQAIGKTRVAGCEWQDARCEIPDG